MTGICPSWFGKTSFVGSTNKENKQKLLDHSMIATLIWVWFGVRRNYQEPRCVLRSSRLLDIFRVCVSKTWAEVGSALSSAGNDACAEHFRLFFSILPSDVTKRRLFSQDLSLHLKQVKSLENSSNFADAFFRLLPVAYAENLHEGGSFRVI